jgi:hypothetical protein
MEETYSFVVSADELKKESNLQDIVKRILKQTIECGYFIQEYMRHDFRGMWRVSQAVQQADPISSRESDYAALFGRG